MENDQITFIVSNHDGILTNIGTGVDIKSLERIDENTDRVKDTIHVFTNSYRKVYLRNEDDFKSIICESGDTIYLNILKGEIDFSFKNKELKKYDTLPVATLYKKHLKNELSKTRSFRANIFEEDEWTRKISINQEFLNGNKNAFIDYHLMIRDVATKSNTILLKLFEQDSISSSYYIYNKSQNDYKEFSTLLEIFNYSGDVYLKNQIFKYYQSNEIITDNFMAYGYVNRLLNDVYIKTNNYDFKETFDSLPLQISGDALKYAQLICLKEIASKYNYKTYKLYSKKYLDDLEKTSRLQSIVKKFDENHPLRPNFILEKDFKELKLRTTNGRELTFNQLLKNESGKIVYVDFWASWCVPCRASMPDSRKLQKDFINEDIAFVFVSIDKDSEKWNEASSSEGLTNSAHNLLAVNFPSANFYEKLDLKSIPRYLLFNKNGELEHRDAPDPGNKKTKVLLKKLLIQE